MYNYKVDKNGQIIEERIGNQRDGYISFDFQVDATKFLIKNGILTEKPIKQEANIETVKPEKTNQDLNLIDFNTKRYEFNALLTRLYNYKICGARESCNPYKLFFTLLGIIGEEDKDNATKWVKAVLDVTKDIENNLTEETIIPSFEELRNKAEEIFYQE